MTLKLGEICAGYGGLGLGLGLLADVDTRWVADVDTGPSRILARHWPDSPNLGDITRIDWATIEPVDVIAGGTPCQDLSNAGHRAGMRPGTRSGIWEAMAHAIEEIKPHVVVWENVAGARSAAAYSRLESGAGRLGGGADRPVLRALGRVVGDLAGLGYDAAWASVRASDVGAPHRRERVFVLAWRPDAADTLRVLRDRPRGARGRRNEPTDSRRVAAGVTPAPQLLPTPAVNDMGAGYSPESWDGWTERMRERHGNNGHGRSLSIEARRSSGYWAQYAPAIRRWEEVTGREAPPPTEAGQRGGDVLSPRFVEWMMGLPAGHVTDTPGLSRSQALKALGNGVVPQQAAHAVSHLAETALNHGFV